MILKTEPGEKTEKPKEPKKETKPTGEDKKSTKQKTAMLNDETKNKSSRERMKQKT